MRSFSSLALITANLIPLIGVIFYQWDAKLVLALFWIENLIIGAFNVLKILAVIAQRKRFREIFVCGFFILHYGLFCSIHGTVLWDLLNLGSIDQSVYFDSAEFGPLDLFIEGATVLLSFIDMYGRLILLGIVALSLSHLVSFIENFLLGGEIFKQRVNSLMAKPYSQIIVMHAGLLLGAIALEKLGSPVWLVALIVLFKIVVDLAQHRRRHRALTNENKLIKDI